MSLDDTCVRRYGHGYIWTSANGHLPSLPMRAVERIPISDCHTDFRTWVYCGNIIKML